MLEMSHRLKAMTFEDFVRFSQMKGSSRNAWVKQPTGLKIYVRRAIRIPGGFELASLELLERKQKKGIFSRFLEEYETTLPLLIENVQNTDLDNHLRKRPHWRLLDPEQYISPTFINERWATLLIKISGKT